MERIKFPFFKGSERARRVHFQRKRSIKDKVWQAARVHALQMKGKGWEVPIILMIMENSRAFRDHRVQGFTKSFKEYWPLEILCSKGISCFNKFEKYYISYPFLQMYRIVY